MGALIARQRNRLNVTQEELAAMLGVTRSTLANIEGGRAGTTIHRLVAIADILDCPIARLLPPR